ncbi:MAG TPA: cation:proton antiporter [Actinobacteria bacterium]|nr:cation:proton antiporter [Actinomycetota bacterium]
MSLASPSINFLLTLLGIAILIGFFGGKLGKKFFKAPQVVGFIIIGLILGESFLGIFKEQTLNSLDMISSFALAFIGFAIGGEMAIAVFKKLGKSIFTITILESLGAFLFVTIAIYAFTQKLTVALLFGALASATAPAATVDVLREYESSGPLTTTLYAVVGLDDAAAIMIYAFATVMIKTLLTHENISSILHLLEGPFLEIGRSLFIGMLIGIVLAYTIKKMHDREALMILGVGSIVLCTGLALTFHSSLILSNMAMGATVINLTKRTEIFDVVQRITPPIFVLFFILAGARLQVSLLAKLGLIGLAYIVNRVLGKSIGTWIGGRVSNAPETVRKYLGFCLLSQAGVAIGLSIQALSDFQAYGAAGRELGLLAINVIAGTTLIFQIIGPPFTKWAIFKANEVPEERR